MEPRESSSFFNSWSWKKNRSPSTQQVLGRDPLSSQQMCRLQQDKQMLTEEVKAQKVISIRTERSFNPLLIRSSLRAFLGAHTLHLLCANVQELVWILHKALEASQLEKRSCAQFLAEKGEQERLEVLRHRERQAAKLQGQLEEAKVEAEALRRCLAQRNVQLDELEEQLKMLMEKNNAKLEVRTDGSVRRDWGGKVGGF